MSAQTYRSGGCVRVGRPCWTAGRQRVIRACRSGSGFRRSGGPKLPTKRFDRRRHFGIGYNCSSSPSRSADRRSRSTAGSRIARRSGRRTEAERGSDSCAGSTFGRHASNEERDDPPLQIALVVRPRRLADGVALNPLARALGEQDSACHGAVTFVASPLERSCIGERPIRLSAPFAVRVAVDGDVAITAAVDAGPPGLLELRAGHLLGLDVRSAELIARAAGGHRFPSWRSFPGRLFPATVRDMASRIVMSNGDHLEIEQDLSEVQDALNAQQDRLVQFTGHRHRPVLVNPNHVAYVASAL